MLTIPEMNGLDVAFGNISHMPKYETVPDDFKRGSNVYCRAISSWFFSGAKGTPDGLIIGDAKFSAKPGVDRNKALAAIKAVLGSYEPKHEHKEAACAYMLSEWFDREEQKAKA